MRTEFAWKETEEKSKKGKYVTKRNKEIQLTCGISVSPTVIPATISPTAQFTSYFGSQFKIGNLLYKVFFVNVF